MRKIFLVLGCSMYLSTAIFAQKAPVKFGDVKSDLVEMTTHPLDTTADAVVLMDYGVTTFRYNQEKETFYYYFERVIRTKILSKDGLQYGDFEIPFYVDASLKEQVTGLKGYTYNSVDGSVKKSKLEKSSIFDEKSTDNWHQKKISMPDVQVGSVVELTYTLNSPFKWNLQTWSFQAAIPTAYSEYNVTIPEYYDYQLLHSGYIGLEVNESSSIPGSIVFNSKSRQVENRAITKTNYSSSKVDYMNKRNRWVAKNVPAFIPESYIACPNDYISKMKFELRGTRFPSTGYKQYMGTWASLNKTFLDHEHFGNVLDQTGYMKDALGEIQKLETGEEKITALVKLIKSQIEWNNVNSKYISSTLRQSWNNKKGNTADINLTIVAGLRALGIKSNPVLISTRSHGMIRKNFAVSSQFNTVVATAELEDRMILLDGTDRYLPIGVLPKRCLNSEGWQVSESTPGWVKLTPTTNEELTFQGKFEIDLSGSVKGNIDLMEKGYAGYASRKLYDIDGEEDYFDKIQHKNEDWVIEEYKYEEEGSLNEPFKSHYVVEMNEDLLVAGDRIYFDPTLNEVMDENPFKVDEREYPVDFAFPLKRTYMFKFTIPEGYEIEELPQSTAFGLPGKGGIFQYSISNIGSDIQVVASFRINKTMFAQTEYPVLKQFYHQVVQKCKEQVVLKKKHT